MGAILAKIKPSKSPTLENGKNFSPKIFPTKVIEVPENFPITTSVIEVHENSKILTQFILNNSLYDDTETPIQSKRY